MNMQASEYFKSARMHLFFAKKHKKDQDRSHMRMSLEWAQQDHAVARKILREARV